MSTGRLFRAACAWVDSRLAATDRLPGKRRRYDRGRARAADARFRRGLRPAHAPWRSHRVRLISAVADVVVLRPARPTRASLRRGDAGYRTAPAWTGTVSHPLIVVVGLGLAGVLWLQRRRGAGTGSVSEREALLLLALVLLLRCLLDTWDIGYYMLPC